MKSMKIVSLARRKKRGTPTFPLNCVSLIEGHGIKGDSPVGPWCRQVSFLAAEIRKLYHAA
jgi:hypothetical protein